jgi:hypothetical protein
MDIASFKIRMARIAPGKRVCKLLNAIMGSCTRSPRVGTTGLIGKKVTADAAHLLLQALLPQDARSIYNFHKALLRHGNAFAGMSARAVGSMC